MATAGLLALRSNMIGYPSQIFKRLSGHWLILNQSLADYSCGGSFGIAFKHRKTRAPNSLLSAYLIKFAEPYEMTIPQAHSIYQALKHNI